MDLLDSLVPKLSDLVEASIMQVVEAGCRWRKYPAGTLIQQRGERAKRFFLIRSGHVNGNNVDFHGSTLSSGILGPGDCFGEFTIVAGLPWTFDVWALEPVELGSISAKRFNELAMQYPTISKALLTISLRRNYVMQEFLDSVRRLPLDVRIAKLLLVNVWDAESETIRIRQESLASTFGVSRMSVSTALSKLEQARLLERGYRKIKLNRRQLSRWVGERDLVPPVFPDDLIAAFRQQQAKFDSTD